MSILRWSLRLIYAPVSKSLTLPAIVTLNPVVSNKSGLTVSIPLLPARILSQAVFILEPTGETIPRPVTTTRLLDNVVFLRLLSKLIITLNLLKLSDLSSTVVISTALNKAS